MFTANPRGRVFGIGYFITCVCALGILMSAGAVAATSNDAGTAQADSEMNKEKQRGKDKKKSKGDKMPALQFKMKDIDGREQDLRQYYGNVILMVNVASYCGFTPQYKGLQEMYDKYKDRGFVILAFPANEFGKQEPGTDSEIKEFCSTKFSVKFPIFSKVVVKGEGICPLYEYLTSERKGYKFDGEIKWNFNKFLIDRKGRVVGRFTSADAPEAPKLVKAVEKQLSKPIPEDSPLAKAEKPDDSPQTKE